MERVKKSGMRFIHLAIILSVLLFMQCQQKTFYADEELLDEITKNVDFSYAGFKNGEETFNLKPEGWPVLNVQNFGAIPDDGKDDVSAIQLAVDSAAILQGAVVFFPPGTFDFDVNTRHRYVKIRHSNVVILGSGEGEDGTTLFDHTASTWPDMSRKWLAGNYPSFFEVGPDSALPKFQFQPELLVSDVKAARINTNEIRVSNPEKLVKGKTYLITLRDTGTRLTEELCFPLKDVAKNYRQADNESAYRFRQMVTVADIVDDLVILDQPLLWGLKEEYHPMLWELPYMINNIAIAGFHLKTNWQETFWHHKNPEHDNGWDHIKLSYAQNAEILSIRHENASTAISLKNCKNITVRQCQITGSPGHNGFVVGGFSSRIMFRNCKGGKQMHTFSMQGNVTGNVFFNCYSDQPSAIDLHGGLMVHNLFDNIYGATMKNGGHPNNTPPAHAHGLVIWSWYPGPFEPYKSRIQNVLVDLTTIPGATLNGISGMYSQPLFISVNDSLIDNNYVSGWGTVNFGEPSIKSLYQHQLMVRTGKNVFNY